MNKFKWILLVALITSSCSKLPTGATVMVTNLTGNSGGSGSVVSSGILGSQILTNGHVCKVIENGGLVHSDNDIAFITSYRTSAKHDLCLINTLTRFPVTSQLSEYIPAPYEPATVLGHPHLLPQIITEGYFSHKQTVSIMIGTRPCTEAEKVNIATSLYCTLVGQIPIIKTYEGVVISSLIQPGSSGSAVYDVSNKISSVVFAGSSDLSFGLAVPFEYVYNFINYEAPTLEPVVVNATFQFVKSSEPSNTEVIKKISTFCNDTIMSEDAWQLCNTFTSTTKYNDLIYRTK